MSSAGNWRQPANASHPDTDGRVANERRDCARGLANATVGAADCQDSLPLVGEHQQRVGINFAQTSQLKFHPPSTLERDKSKRARDRIKPREAEEEEAEEEEEGAGRPVASCSEEKEKFLASNWPEEGAPAGCRGGAKGCPNERACARGLFSAVWSCCCCRCCCCRRPALDPEASKQCGKESEQLEAKMRARRRLLRCAWLALLLLLVYCVSVYCLPFIEIEPSVPAAPPSIPFDYSAGPLRPSTASQFRVEHLFRGQIHGPESLAMDAQGNAYMAIEGGLVLYAHLNRSAPNRWLVGAPPVGQSGPELIRIAELNGVKPVQRERLSRGQRASGPDQGASSFHFQEAGSSWRRECQLDEQLYGSPPFSAPDWPAQRADTQAADQQSARPRFVSRVRASRCSKPLGTRLSPDESALYVVDTMSGLFKVHLRLAERKQSSLRLVSKLVDFAANNWHQRVATAGGPRQRHMNVSLRAVDDLAIDFGAGTKGGDLIYMSVASQQWPALGFVYDALEGRPSGLVVRYDTGQQQLVALEPSQLAHVRTSNYGLQLADNAHGQWGANQSAGLARLQQVASFGAPRLDENDIFDDRPLHFANGLELTDDKQALLVVDTMNKRILKHHVGGPRRGTSDLWAYTPNYPDNIRRGYDKRHETYWVVGCGAAHKSWETAERPGHSNDLLASLRAWPMVKKFLLKNVYFVGWLIEHFGQDLIGSPTVRDYGYQLRIGSSLCQNSCKAMMVLQYNGNGDLIRSIHSSEFPNDLKYYSQVNELIDAQNQEHALYLGSPSYDYVTKLILPTESYASNPWPSQAP